MTVGANFIAGKWISGDDGNVDVVSPVSGKKLGHFSKASLPQIHQAIEAANTAQKKH